MARLIPSFVDDATPPGERDVFQMLAGGPNDWVVLHSLDLAPWNRRRRTEIDFVAIVPDTGILCIEVKSQEYISFDNDRWNPPSISRSPFKQALDSRFALSRRLADVLPFGRRIPIVHCCIFPRSRFDLSATLSVRDDELIDARTFTSFRSGSALCGDLIARMRRSIAADPDLQPRKSPLTAFELDQIVACFVPVQRRHPEAREEIMRREQEIECLLREQQKPVLQLFSLNDRLLISGGAGTGKTLIALELARRAAEQGQRVGLLCFNRLVSVWMQNRVGASRPQLPNLVVGRVIRSIADMVDVTIPPDVPDSYWEETFPDLVEERLTDPEFGVGAMLDCLILDEAQDILSRPRLWTCLLQFVSGGLEHGRFTLLGDFEHQVLGRRTVLLESIDEVVQRGRCTRWHLSENCRNYRIIGETALRMSGFATTVYTGFRRTGGGHSDLSVAAYETDSAQRVQLAQWIRGLRSGGYQDREISVLSFCEPSRSAAASLASTEPSLVPAHEFSDRISYTSVHAFKGMENKVVILTDLVVGEQGFYRDVFYTAMTRSTGAVMILCHKESTGTILRWIADSSNA